MSSDAIDKSALDKLLNAIGGDQEDLDELIDDFATEGPDLVSSLKQSAHSQDWNQMRIASHSLKSNAREFGATALAELCQTLERDCQAGQVSDPGQRVEQIDIALQSAVSKLLALRAHRA